MEAKISRWGNSLGLRIPKAFAEQIGVGEGSAVDLSIDGGDLVVRVHRPALRLEDLLAGVTDGNIHDEMDFGQPVGREAW